MNLYAFSSKPENGMKAGEAESFVVQYPGEKHAAEAWVQSESARFHHREYICTPLPIKKDKPVVICHYQKPVELEPKTDIDVDDEDDDMDMDGIM